MSKPDLTDNTSDFSEVDDVENELDLCLNCHMSFSADILDQSLLCPYCNFATFYGQKPPILELRIMSETDIAIISQEMFLVQDLLVLMTHYDLGHLNFLEFFDQADNLLCQYMELPDYNLPIIDDLITIMAYLEDPKQTNHEIEQLKSYLMTFIKMYQSQLGNLIILGSFHAKDYEQLQNQYQEKMIAFLRNFADDHFGVWYLDTESTTNMIAY